MKMISAMCSFRRRVRVAFDHHGEVRMGRPDVRLTPESDHMEDAPDRARLKPSHR